MNRTPVVLILNSAQSRYPRGNDPWVKATVRAFEQLAGRDISVITSADPLMWNFSAWLASEHGMYIRHIVPDFDPTKAAAAFEETLAVFGIPREHASPLYLTSPRSLTRTDMWHLRDLTALKTADIIYPVSLRPGGRLDSMLRTEPVKAEIRNTFGISWRTADRRTPVYDLLEAELHPLPAENWLVHWTRSSPGPWPGESEAAFFRDMLAHPSIYVRSARETLIRILREKYIRASSWKIPGQVPVVSLTENTPETAVTLMKWRKRFIRYTYEPYGIAIRRQHLESIGARRVVYAGHANAPDADAWMYQSPGEFADWTREREWRYPGDLQISTLGGKNWFVIVPRGEDREYAEKQCGGIEEKMFVLFGG